LTFPKEPFTPEEESMFEQQYDDEMIEEIRRLEAKQRALAAGHPEWSNACKRCSCELTDDVDLCARCSTVQ
jgi:hypothetical protein